MKWIAIIIFFGFTRTTLCQVVHPGTIPGYLALGTYSGQFTDVFSCFANPASAARIKRSAAGISAERKFLLKELQQIHAVAAIPIKQGTMAVQLMYNGFSQYNLANPAVAYARALGEQAQLGIRLNYIRIGAAGYGNASTATFEVGALFQVTDQLFTGLSVSNPAGGRLSGSSTSKIGSCYAWGLGLQASDLLLISAELRKLENQPVDVNIGMHYSFLPQFFARAGVSTGTDQYYGGISFRQKSLRIDCYADWHPQLGFTPGLSVIFQRSEAKPAAP